MRGQTTTVVLRGLGRASLSVCASGACRERETALSTVRRTSGARGAAAAAAGQAMVMFGAQLDNERVEEWAAGYVDYGHLKKVLSELVRSGKSQALNHVDSKPCRPARPKRLAGRGWPTL